MHSRTIDRSLQFLTGEDAESLCKGEILDI